MCDEFRSPSAYWLATVIRYCADQTPEVVWPRGPGRQVSRSFPCSTSLHIACPKELEAASRSSKTYLAKNGGGRSAPLLSDTVRIRRLKLFGHVARADKSQDHSRALPACISPAPRNWRRRPGRPRHTWLRTVEEDLRQFNLGLASGLRRAQNRTAWRNSQQQQRHRQAPIDDDLSPAVRIRNVVRIRVKVRDHVLHIWIGWGWCRWTRFYCLFIAIST